MISIEWLKKNYGYLIAVCIAFGFIIFSFIAPKILVLSAKSNDLIFTDTGNIGDTIGGLMNPFIAIAAAILTFLAFFIQFKANQDIRNQFKIQQFESQFYEMLRLHKENVNEMKITGYGIAKENTEHYEKTKKGKKKNINYSETTTQTIRLTEGRKVFVTMCTELIACYELIEYYNKSWELDYSKNDLLEFAYRIFFFGLNSEVVLSKVIDKSVVDNIKIELENARTLHLKSIGEKNRFSGVGNKTIKLYFKYKPFSGHESRLGHYYRHLYSTVKFVVSNENKLFSYNEVRGYLKILRSQMSNDEQLMLYYNCVIGFGKDWEDNGYLTKYRMLHNLPINKVKYAENPIVHFMKYIETLKDGDGNLFEWGDV